MIGKNQIDLQQPPRDALRVLPAKHSGCFRTVPYPPFEGSVLVLRKSVDVLRINSDWALAKLLGCPWPHQIYTWLDGTKRPSSLYMSRLVWLHIMHANGARLRLIDSIDWDAGEIIWKETLSTFGKDPLRASVAKFMDQRPDKPSARS